MSFLKWWQAVGALLLVAGSPGHAQGAMAPQKTALAGERAAAVALATIVAPSDLMVELEVRTSRQAFAAGLQAEADSRALLEQYPGLQAALWTRIEPEIRRSSQADLSPFRNMLADMFILRLTRGEIQGLRSFYTTPTGQKLIRAMYGNMDATGVTAEMIRTGDAKADPSAIGKVVNAAKAKSLGIITEEDRPALMKLATVMPMAKLQSVGVEMQRASIEWGNKPNPELDARLDALIQAEIVAHMAARKPKN